MISSLQARGNASPSNSFLSGAVGNSTTSTAALPGTAQVQQTVPWGANYTVGWDGVRSTTNSLFSTFSPQLRSSVSLSYTQQLMRGFSVDSTRQQVQTNLKQREIADVQLRQTLATTSRTVRIAYWDLAYAIASLRVQQQSLDLARESLRNTRARIEIGTTPPIDEIQQQAEVAQSRRSRDHGRVPDRHRRGHAAHADLQSRRSRFLVDSISSRSNVRSCRTRPISMSIPRCATRSSTAPTWQQARKQLEASDINIHFLRDQTRPELTADLDYGLSGLGGTQLLRSGGLGLDPGTVSGTPSARFRIGPRRPLHQRLSDLDDDAAPDGAAGTKLAGSQPGACPPAIPAGAKPNSRASSCR